MFQSSLSSQLSANTTILGQEPEVFYHRLGQHFTPALILWLPLYALFPSPVTLTAVQVTLVTAAGIVLYLLAREYLPPTPSRWLVVAFYCANTVVGPTLGNFHDIVQIPLFIFALLLAMRVTGLEDTLRASARAVLRAEGAFDGRRDFQRILVASLVMIGGGLGLWLVYKAARGSRRKIDVVVKAALGAGLVMGGLIALRFVSLHAVDRLLYGALKLNWVTDVGASCTILVAAL